MKKGLMMAIAASTVLFAGGDIAPVQPVAEAPAAACNDFYGHAAVGITATMNDANTTKDTNTTKVAYGLAAVLGVNKEILSGLTLNVEVQGATIETAKKVGDGNVTRAPGFVEQGGLTQFNLGYSFGNTAIKVGRFAVPEALSPLIYTDTNYFGLKDLTVEGVMVANTDLADTTLWAAYAHNVVTFKGNPAAKRARFGVIAAGLQNKSFADTTITLAGYYDANITGSKNDWKYKVAGSVDHSFDGITVSLGAAVSQPDATDANLSYVVGGYVAKDFGSFDATLAATYSNTGLGYSKYTSITNPVGEKGFGVGVKLNTTVSGFKLNAKASYSKGSDTNNSKTVAGVGVSKTFSGINFALDYQYTKAAGVSHRVRAKAVYKF